MEQYQCELLAPAGNLDIFYAVLNAGADAVYLGGDKFGARAYANNFNQEELLTAIRYAHLHGKKVFLTLNTLLKETELRNEVYPYLLPFYQEGLDAVIIQDLGLIPLLRSCFPKLAIHASTQMSISNVFGAELLKNNGVERIVTARELSLAEISNIYHKTGLEIESFVHGALCYCYSGQCLMSSMIGGRSGNRGRCAQPCRLPYDLYDDEHKKTVDKKYLLSLKDLCTISYLPDILNSGIYSLKIEGRMKQASYAAGVVNIYRKQIDLLKEKGEESYKVEKKDMESLLATGNRSGFTSGYYFQQNHKNMITYQTANHMSEEDNSFVPNSEPCKLEVEASAMFKVGEVGRLILKCQNHMIEERTQNLVQCASKRPLQEDEIRERLQKTGNTNFVFSKLRIQMDQNIFLPIKELNELRRSAVQKLEHILLEENHREVRGFNLDVIKQTQHKIDGPKLTASILKREQLDPLLDCDRMTRIYLPLYDGLGQLPEIEEMCHRIKLTGRQCYAVLPMVFRSNDSNKWEECWDRIEEIEFDGFLAGSLDGFYFLKLKQNKGDKSFQIITDSNLYTMNSMSSQFLLDNGDDQYTVPLELNQHELKQQLWPSGELMIYGRVPLMVTANCVVKTTSGCRKDKQFQYLRDRKGMTFPVRTFCDSCYNMIYNSKPLSLLHLKHELEQLRISSYRISFTTETKAEVTDVLSFMINGYPEISDYTKGHFSRGVE